MIWKRLTKQKIQYDIWGQPLRKWTLKMFKHKIVNIVLPICFSACFGCSKEPSHWDGSFEHPQHMFSLRNKKIIFLSLLLCLTNTLSFKPGLSGALNQIFCVPTQWILKARIHSPHRINTVNNFFLIQKFLLGIKGIKLMGSNPRVQRNNFHFAVGVKSKCSSPLDKYSILSLWVAFSTSHLHWINYYYIFNKSTASTA